MVKNNYVLRSGCIIGILFGPQIYLMDKEGMSREFEVSTEPWLFCSTKGVKILDNVPIGSKWGHTRQFYSKLHRLFSGIYCFWLRRVVVAQ